MANVLPMDRQVAVISALAEGSGIRQIERMTGVHRDTIMRLGVRVGQGCARVLGVESRHVESVPVKEMFQGKTVWEGIVEVFELHGHPRAPRVYAWSHDMNGPKKRHVTVLHIAPITSAVEAVRAAIVQEFRSRGTAEES